MKPVVQTDITDLVNDLADISGMSPEEITANIFNDMGKRITASAKSKAPVKTGALRDSITYEVRYNQLIIGPHVPYAPYMEFGTASRGEFGGEPYVILPKNKPFLVFKVDGKLVFARKVVHPGVAPRPFMRPAVEEVMGDTLDKLAERGAALITKGPKHA